MAAINTANDVGFRQVRFGLMDGGYLATISTAAMCALGRIRWDEEELAGFRVRLDGLVTAAAICKSRLPSESPAAPTPASAPASAEAQTAEEDVAVAAARLRLGPQALMPRVRRGVAWARFAGGGGAGRRVATGHAGEVGAVGWWRGRVVTGSDDGTVAVWDPATLRRVRTLSTAEAPNSGGGGVGGGGVGGGEAEDGQVWCLGAWEGWVLGGTRGGQVWVWDGAAGRAQTVVAAHQGGVNRMAVCGDVLVTASDDGRVGVWRLRSGWGQRDFKPRWGPVCDVGGAGRDGAELRLAGHGGERVLAVVAWHGAAATGGCDGAVRVWDLAAAAAADDGDGGERQVLQGHGKVWVNALALVGGGGGGAAGRRLVSCGADGSVRVWGVGSWACLAAAPSPPCGAVRCLAACGGALVGGVEAGGDSDGADGDAGPAWRVAVWDAESLRLRHVVSGPARAGPSDVVWAVVAADGAVWATAGRDLLGWGPD
jgi:WD40 repeat protein